MLIEEEQYLLLAATFSVLVGCPTFFLHHPDFLILKWHGWPVISKGIKKTAFISFLWIVFLNYHLALADLEIYFLYIFDRHMSSKYSAGHFVKRRKFMGFWNL